MKKITLCMATTLALTACNTDIDIATLPDTEPAIPAVSLPEGTPIADDVIFGEWEATSATGHTNRSYFQQRYAVSFQSTADSTATLSHWFTNATTEQADSLIDLHYTYSVTGTDLTMVPSPAAHLLGADTIHGRATSATSLLLYSRHAGRIDSICTLQRVSDPRPQFVSVDRTMPTAGDTICISGLNLQFVTNVYLPTTNGELEVTPVSKDSKQITLVVPQANYTQGSIRLRASGAHLSTYSPAYMFAERCVFFRNFIASKDKPYTGTEFEYSIKSMGTLMSKVTPVSGTNLPDGHSLTLASGFSNPDSLLSFHGNTPTAWDAQLTSHDKKLGYLRFCTGDRLQWALDHCQGSYTEQTPCSDLAIQMDIYVYSDGKPEWTTGYLSWRINKNNSWNSAMVANLAMWQDGMPVSFGNGWKTFTIPLSAFSVTSTSTARTLGAFIKTSMLESLLCLENGQLDELHTPQSLSEFQFNVANIRLVPYKSPANTTE